ncbi:hypothetical protein AAFC00_001186 [Neodothiora populina]|uniref:Uncharacterized protein n=1 Tax=Neodothiora populina TaxID=2781224 RepID=A0ABR3PN27_9PEZI
MFTGIGAVSLASYVDPTKPRLRPEPPTSVDLPNYSLVAGNGTKEWNSETARPDFRRRYVQLKKPSDINGQLLQDFNFQIQKPAPVNDLVPRDRDGRNYLPYSQDSTTAPLAESAQKHLAAWEARDQELKLDNDIAYRIVCRAKLPEGLERVRLASFRNFFSALEGMSEHWETDLDHYFIAGEDNYQEASFPPGSPGLDSISENEEPKSPSVRSDGSGDAIMTNGGAPKTMLNGFRSDGSQFIFSSSDKDTMANAQNSEELPISPTSLTGALNSNGDFPFRPPPVRSSSMDSNSSSEADIPMPMYKGRRISSGIKMPGLYRTETVKGFLEAAIFNFNCKLIPPRAPAILTVSGVRVPIRHQTFLVQRIPADRTVAKQGIAEGPVMGAFVRQDIEAYSAGGVAQRTERLRLDLLKEMGCLLHLAQERRREGREERTWDKPSPTKGGHWFSEMASDNSRPEDSPSELQTEEERVAAIEAAAERRRNKKVKTKYDVWKEMLPQRRLWDPRIKYTAIGKEPGSDWDEVYMLSSMYHHVSVVKLRVHGAYIDYITDGRMPESLPEDPEWCRPVMQRSEWFDLFNRTQRVEAFRCLWGALCYLNRQPPTTTA